MSVEETLFNVVRLVFKLFLVHVSFVSVPSSLGLAWTLVGVLAYKHQTGRVA